MKYRETERNLTLNCAALALLVQSGHKNVPLFVLKGKNKLFAVMKD